MVVFPFKKFGMTELKGDYKRLRSACIKLSKVDTLKCNPRKGTKCTFDAFQKQRFRTPTMRGKLSAFDLYKAQHVKINKFHNKYKKEHKDPKHHILSAISLYARPPSHFPILNACIIYRKLNAKHVFDPFAGWGDRCIAAMAMDIDYTGVDLNPNIRTGYDRLQSLYKTESKISVTCGRCCTSVQIPRSANVCFSSPPFFRGGVLVEKYKNCETDYKRFVSNVLVKMVDRLRARGVVVALHMPTAMYKDMKRQCNARITYGSKSIKSKNSRVSSRNTVFVWR